MPHEYHLPKSHRQRSLAREGRIHTVDTLKPESTALLVVDVQRYFVEAGYAGASPWGPEIVPNLNRLAAAVRSAGGTVVWLQMRAPIENGDWSSLRNRYSNQVAESRWGSLRPGSPGYELVPELDVSESDLRVVKIRYSPFIRGSSDLHQRLQDLAIDTILIGGVATNVCCESTARDAMMLDYRVLVISNACAAATDEEHASALNNLYLFFCDVQTTEEVLAMLA